MNPTTPTDPHKLPRPVRERLRRADRDARDVEELRAALAQAQRREREQQARARRAEAALAEANGRADGLLLRALDAEARVARLSHYPALVADLAGRLGGYVAAARAKGATRYDLDTDAAIR